MSLLKVMDLKVSYGGIEALKGISFAVEKGQIVTLIGANGAGKSTTLRTISGLVPVKSGTITYDGNVISGQQPQQIVLLFKVVGAAGVSVSVGFSGSIVSLAITAVPMLSIIAAVSIIARIFFIGFFSFVLKKFFLKKCLYLCHPFRAWHTLLCGLIRPSGGGS